MCVPPPPPLLKTTRNRKTFIWWHMWDFFSIPQVTAYKYLTFLHGNWGLCMFINMTQVSLISPKIATNCQQIISVLYLAVTCTVWPMMPEFFPTNKSHVLNASFKTANKGAEKNFLLHYSNLKIDCYHFPHRNLSKPHLFNMTVSATVSIYQLYRPV